MTWYTAHIAMYCKFINGEQSTFLVDENVVLIKADTVEMAHEKATKYGLKHEISDSTTLHDRPVDIVFAGVRKIVTFDEPDAEPADGIEISYSTFEMKDQKSFEKFIKGKSVSVNYID